MESNVTHMVYFTMGNTDAILTPYVRTCECVFYKLWMKHGKIYDLILSLRRYMTDIPAWMYRKGIEESTKPFKSIYIENASGTINTLNLVYDSEKGLVENVRQICALRINIFTREDVACAIQFLKLKTLKEISLIFRKTLIMKRYVQLYESLMARPDVTVDMDFIEMSDLSRGLFWSGLIESGNARYIGEFKNNRLIDILEFVKFCNNHKEQCHFALSRFEGIDREVNSALVLLMSQSVLLHGFIFWVYRYF